MAYIYKIVNDINGKIYIGKTEFSVEKRFQEHCQDAFKQNKEKRPLYLAMKKYGINHFHIEVIEETEIAEEREKYWISYFDTYNNGYNATLGGDGKKLFNYEEIKDMILNKNTYIEIQNKLGCSYDTVLAVAQKYNLTVYNPQSKPVIGINKKTQENFAFDSIIEAAKWIVAQGYTYSNPKDIKSKISQVCKGTRKSAYGFIWQYK